jgi:hypothetical protein
MFQHDRCGEASQEMPAPLVSGNTREASHPVDVRSSDEVLTPGRGDGRDDRDGQVHGALRIRSLSR